MSTHNFLDVRSCLSDFLFRAGLRPFWNHIQHLPPDKLLDEVSGVSAVVLLGVTSAAIFEKEPR